MSAEAQRPQMGKLSPWLRQLVRTYQQQDSPLTHHHSPITTHPSPTAPHPSPLTAHPSPTTTAFIRLTPDGEDVLTEHGCRRLAHYGSLHIASIPLAELPRLTRDRRVLRIEASPTGRLLCDSMAVHLNAVDAYSGQGLPQAYTGKGVVMGVMDVGFDFTHPNFYSRDTTTYRIQRFWDQISADTVGSPFPVGRDFVTAEAILALGHSRDGQDIAHGTHTLGIAAGSGYDTAYQGMAPEADICLVANAVSEDLPFIDPADIEKYTFATDALGFKYIFDYAQSVGKPCVISFSEGSMQDFWGYDQLYYAFLDSLTGPGRILVAASGNEGYKTNWLRKERSRPSAGTFLYSNDTVMYVTAKSADAFTLRLVTYLGEQRDTLLLPSPLLLSQPDSTLTLQTGPLSVTAEAYPSCYDPAELCIDLTLTSASGPLGYRPRLSLELTGDGADVELWRVTGWFTTFAENPLLADGETSHCVHSPSSAPCVISVGATTYRDHIYNIEGDSMAYWHGTDGRLVEFSSTGPTFDHRIKPDCVAPGNNIIASYNSYYLEAHPDASDNRWDVARFPFRGRTYAWNCNSGTSMSTPAVGGAIALWLQACPTLSPQEVMAVLSRTCTHPEPELDYPNNRYGHGQIDVYAGLLDILGFSGITDIPRRHTAARITLSGRQLTVSLPQAADAPLPLRIYDLKGRPVLSTQLPSGTDSHSITLPSFAPGVYAVTVADGSTLVRFH